MNKKTKNIIERVIAVIIGIVLLALQLLSVFLFY